MAARSQAAPSSAEDEIEALYKKMAGSLDTLPARDGHSAREVRSADSETRTRI
ncbi:hypothetical protein FN846DRAFT_910120 [Sphaerosporella brunnea]|uniref:Uncharacterized protein n=1 Tax=Sphaerosporella brunnea TaxID=1250544 RepID=A0A5J5EMS3_9PEZI|nr:hypothetical protein FN846DRAFT_910120 [Sphaerosporella brunnea]